MESTATHMDYEYSSTRREMEHLGKEQTDIRADIKILQHEISSIKATMATKTDLQLLEVKVESHIKDAENRLEVQIKGVENRLEGQIKCAEGRLDGSIKQLELSLNWLKIISIGTFTTLVGSLVTLLYKHLL